MLLSSIQPVAALHQSIHGWTFSYLINQQHKINGNVSALFLASLTPKQLQSQPSLQQDKYPGTTQRLRRPAQRLGDAGSCGHQLGPEWDVGCLGPLWRGLHPWYPPLLTPQPQKLILWPKMGAVLAGTELTCWVISPEPGQVVFSPMSARIRDYWEGKGGLHGSN